MIPNTRLRTLEDHKYNFGGFEVLKVASVYGANGAGKSNLIKSLDLLKKIITEDASISRVRENQFKFQDENYNPKQLFAIEFFQEGKAFYYALEIINNVVSIEELYESALGNGKDKLIYERKTNFENKTTITFTDDFEKDSKSQILKEVLLEDFVKPNRPILRLISNRDNEFLSGAKDAFKWFSNTLRIITPDSKPSALAQKIETDNNFKNYAEEIMCSFHVGVTSIISEKEEINDFFGNKNGEDVAELIQKVEDSPAKMFGLRSARGGELIISKENDKTYVKQLKLEHKGRNGIIKRFDLEEESDGTIRLLDFIPAFKDLISKGKVFFIDEIERSIHPLLIKELLRKFISDKESTGQLIFTTHESNLLDQDLFRQDEIWFAEKDTNGVTDLYSLSDFKEHKTIDIRKGYLNGRYGSIPFLANLKDLNWHKDDTN